MLKSKIFSGKYLHKKNNNTNFAQPISEAHMIVGLREEVTKHIKALLCADS